jgi:hypothetical protein
MESILKLLSPYELRARTLPGMLLVAPVIALLAVLLPIAHSWQALTAIGFGWFALGFPIGQWLRDVAQPKQAALFTAWGGAPTTQLLRWSDSTLSNEEKAIARNSILRLGEFKWLDAAQERANPGEADAYLKAIVSMILAAARRALRADGSSFRSFRFSTQLLFLAIRRIHDLRRRGDHLQCLLGDSRVDGRRLLAHRPRRVLPGDVVVLDAWRFATPDARQRRGFRDGSVSPHPGLRRRSPAGDGILDRGEHRGGTGDS